MAGQQEGQGVPEKIGDLKGGCIMENDTTAYKCAHCDWAGKNILQHMRYNQICMDKTDMEDLREKVKKRNKLTKKSRDDEHYKQNKEDRMEYYEEHREDKMEYYEENRENKMKYQTNYDRDHREDKRKYQKNYDKNHKKEKMEYYENHQEERKEYQRKYDREHKKERKQRDKFYKRFVKYGGDESWEDPCASGFNDFITPAAEHIYRHSLGICQIPWTDPLKTGWNGKPICIENYTIDEISYSKAKISNKTITAHEIDRSIQNEVCCSCGNKLIKLHNINRMQCVKCYGAKCYNCKSSVNPDLYKAYEHFWVPRFNSFVPGLCSYFENSTKSDICWKDTCESCERSDQGLHPTINNHYSEDEGRYLCNEKCPGEFSTICKALSHCAKAHPPMTSDSVIFLELCELNEEGHINYKNGKCYCSIIEEEIDAYIEEDWPEVLSNYRPLVMPRKISRLQNHIKRQLENKMNLDNGVYKCKFVCKKSFNYPCEMWCHLDEGGKHWDNPDKDRSFCGMDQSHEKKRIMLDKDKVDICDATNWVVDQVKNTITKICCCHEEKGLFCHFSETEFSNNGPLTQTHFQFISSVGHPYAYKDQMGGCCRKCKDEDFKLPVYIHQDEIYVKLPENIFRFSKVFKSFVKMKDCAKKNTVQNCKENDSSDEGAQGSIEKSSTDTDDDSEEESEGNTDSSSTYNSSEDESTNCGGFSGDEYIE